MSIEYQDQGSPLAKAGARYFNAVGYHQEFAEMANLSHAVTIPANARVVHVGGQLGWTKDGSIPATIEDEYRQAFLNVEKSLAAAGVKEGWKAVYKCHAFHRELSDERLDVYGKLSLEFCGSNKPTMVSVSASIWGESNIEIFVEAVVV